MTITTGSAGDFVNNFNQFSPNAEVPSRGMIYEPLFFFDTAKAGWDALLVACGPRSCRRRGWSTPMRAGPDIAADSEPPGDHPTLPSQRNAARNVIARGWQHGRFWVNDPDCLMLRPQVQRRADWADVVARYGGLRASGDGLHQLDEWGLETTRRLLTPSPVDPVKEPRSQW